MDETLRPDEALRISADTRRAAAVPGLPAWLPACAGSTIALAMAAMGASGLAPVGSAAAHGLLVASMVLVVLHLAVYGELWRRWRRGGLVPLMDARVRRRGTGVGVLLACAAGAGLAMSGHAAWGTVCAGLLLGAATWYRLSGQARAQ